MSKSDTWMPLYVGDYLRDTGHLTAIEHGAYLLLLMQAWTREGSLPADDERLRVLARMDRKDWAKARGAVLEFFVRDGDTYRNPRLDRELARAIAISSDRSKAGANGAAKRWQKAKQGAGKPIANAMANASQTDAPSQSPSPEEETPSPPSVVRSPQGSRLPADWMPSEDDRAFAASLGLDPMAVGERFRDFWCAKPGKDGRKTDWPATWRNWCRRDTDSRGKPGAAKPPTVLGQWADLLTAKPTADFDGHAEEVFQ